MAYINGNEILFSPSVNFNKEVQPLEVTENGTYTAPDNIAYSPVTVNVSKGGESGENKLNQFVTGTLVELTSSDLEGATQIKNGLFESNKNLEKVFIPHSVTIIGKYAFQNCSSLKDIVFEENSQCYLLDTEAFRSCESLESITMPDSVTTCSGSGVFEYCYNLKTVKLSNSLTTMGNSMFYDCSNLTSITIPSGVTSIGSSALRGCRKLVSITIDTETPPTIQSNTFQGLPTDCVFTVKNRALYESATNWSSLINTYTFIEKE